MFKIGDEVVIVDKRSKNFGKTAVVKNVHVIKTVQGASEVLIEIKGGGWSGWLPCNHVESVKKPSAQKIKESTKKNVPFLFILSDEKNLTEQLIREKMLNGDKVPILLFGDNFEDVKDTIINLVEDTWGHNEWNNIYVVSGDDYFHIGKEVVVKKI